MFGNYVAVNFWDDFFRISIEYLAFILRNLRLILDIIPAASRLLQSNFRLAL
jgi:hypothetical protein